MRKSWISYEALCEEGDYGKLGTSLLCGVKKVIMAMYGGPICPAIQDKFENIKHDSRNYFASPAGKGKFEVEF